MKRSILSTIVVLLPFWFSLPAHAENWEQVQQLLSTKRCAGCELQSAGFAFAKLSGANLKGALLSRANLSRADLSYADLSGADLRGAILAGANLTGANLTGANLTGADLQEAFLLDVTLTNANLTGTNLRKVAGLPALPAKAEDFYRWGLEDYRRGVFVNAIQNYNQSVNLNPDFAPAYLGRAIALVRAGNVDSAMQDAKLAVKLFETQGNQDGTLAARNFIDSVEKSIREKDADNGGGGSLMNLLGSIVPLLFQFSLL